MRNPAARTIRIPVLLAGMTLLFTIPWIFFEPYPYLDVGWNASKAWMIVEHPAAAFWEFSWLSSMVGGLWMKLTSFSLIPLRVGFILITLGTVMIAYAILRLYYRPRESGLALVPMFLLAMAGFEQMIPNYYTVPALFGLASVWFYLKSFHTLRRRNVVLLSIASGVLFAAAVQARIPSIVFGLTFFLVPFVERYAERKEKKEGEEEKKNRWIRPLSVTAGFLLGTGVILLLLWLTGNLRYMIDGLVTTYSDVSSYDGGDNIHNPFRLVQDTVTRYFRILLIGSIVLAGARIWKRLYPKREPEPKDPLTWAVLGAAGLLTFLFVFNGWGSFPPTFGIITILFLAVLFNRGRSLSRERAVLYAVAFCYLVLMNAGSSNPGAGNMKYMAWIFVPVTLLESLRAVSPRISFRMIRLLFLANVLVLAVTGRLTTDKVSVFEMRTPYRTATLRGVHNTQRDVEEFERLSEALVRAGLRPGDTTISYVDAPIFHFTTQTVPALINPWVSDRSVGLPSLERTRAMLADAERRGSLPKFVIRSHLLNHAQEFSIPKIRFLDSLWGAHGYDTVWRQERFVVLRR